MSVRNVVVSSQAAFKANAQKADAQDARPGNGVPANFSEVRFSQNGYLKAADRSTLHVRTLMAKTGP